MAAASGRNKGQERDTREGLHRRSWRCHITPPFKLNPKIETQASTIPLSLSSILFPNDRFSCHTQVKFLC